MAGKAQLKQFATRSGISWGPFVVTLLILLAAAGGTLFYFFGRTKPVPTVAVERGTAVRAFYATGVVRPDYEYVVKSKAQGALVGLSIREGSHASKGQIIATVDDKTLKNEVERCTAEVAEAEKLATDDSPQRHEILARLTEAQAQTKLAQENLQRTQTSFEHGAANFTDLDTARRAEVQWTNTVAALESQLGTWKISSQRSLDVARANLRKAQSNLADADVVAPIDGIVLERYVENQEVVGINQKLLLMAAPDDMLMKAAVDEEDITRCQTGQRVDMQLYAFQTRDGSDKPNVIHGKVIEILPSANPTNKTYEVKVKFDQPPEGLMVGMTGELNFIEEFSGEQQTLLVPSSAVLDHKVYRPIKGIASTLNGGYEAVPVKIGIRTLDQVEITEGLKEGDLIVKDAKQVAPVKLPPPQQPVVPTRTGDVAEK